MFGACPCVSAREAVFGLALFICAAVWSPVFLGADFGTLWAAFVKTPSDPPIAFAIWGIGVAGGLVVLGVGIRQNIADGHGAPVLSSLVTITACAFAIHRQWYLPSSINVRQHVVALAVVGQAVKGFEELLSKLGRRRHASSFLPAWRGAGSIPAAGPAGVSRD